MTIPDLKLVGLLLILCVLAALLWRVMTDKNNTLACWQFIATRTQDGSHAADLDKLGKLAGIVFGGWAVMKIAFEDSVTGHLLEYAAVLTAYLSFVGGAAGWSAYLRAKTPTTTPSEGK